jgi:hypothetical protein
MIKADRVTPTRAASASLAFASVHIECRILVMMTWGAVTPLRLRSSETHAVAARFSRMCRDARPAVASDHGPQGTEVAGATGAMWRGKDGHYGSHGI